MIDIDHLYRDSAPDPDDDRGLLIARRVLARLERRRRRVRAARLAAAAAPLLALAALVSLQREPEAPGAPVTAAAPAPTAPRETPSAASPAPRSIARKARRASPAPPAAPLDPARRLLELCDRPGSSADEIATILRSDVLDRGPAAIQRVAREVRSRARSGARRGGGTDWMDRLSDGVGVTGAPEAWPVLAAVFESRAPAIASIDAAGRIGEPSAAPVLARCLYLGDRRAPAAAAALGRVPGGEALAALLHAHAQTRGAGRALLPGVAEEIEAALRMRDEEMRRLLLDPGAPPHVHLFQAIADLRAPAALSGLIDLLERPDLRSAARRFLRIAAGKDLGAAPEAWRLWLATEALAPGEPPPRSGARVAALPSMTGTHEKA